MPNTIALIGALDTKGHEFAFVKQEIERRGHQTLVINTGVMDELHALHNSSASVSNTDEISARCNLQHSAQQRSSTRELRQDTGTCARTPIESAQSSRGRTAPSG